MRYIPLLFTVFLDSLGFGLAFPIFTPLLLNNEGGMFSPETSLALRGLVFGLLISSFCFGQFFGGPLWGALSDRRGRKKILIISLWVAFFGYILAGFGIIFQSLIILFIARVVSGLAAGNYAVAQSSMTDISSEEDKSKNFGLIGMAWGSGFVIGPYMGGKLAGHGYTFVFAAAALFCLFNIVLLYWWFKESLKQLIPSKINWFYGVFQLKKAIGMHELRGIFLVIFAYGLGWGFFTEFSPVFLTRHFGFNVSQVGNFYAWVGIWIALSQGLLIRPLLKRYSPHFLLPLALFGLGALLPFTLYLQGIVSLFWYLPLIAFSQALIFPTAATIVSNMGSTKAQGEILGMFNSIQWAAIALSPLFSGSLVAIYPHLPITVCSVSMLGGFVIFLWYFKRKKQPIPEIEDVDLPK